MAEVIISIPRINCNGCVKNVTRALEALPGVVIVGTELARKTIHLRYEPEETPLETIKSALADAKYPVVDEQPVV